MKFRPLSHRIAIIFFLLGVAVSAGLWYARKMVNVRYGDRGIAIARVDTKHFADVTWEIARTQSEFLARSTREGSDIMLPGGSQQISKTIVIPRGFAVHVPAGAKYVFAPNVSLISYSPLIFEDGGEPVSITTGSMRRPFGGIVIIGASGVSRLQNLIVQNGSGVYVDGVLMTGSLTLFQSDSSMRNVTFSHNQGEDGLSIKHASTTIEGSLFGNNARDGLDLDDSTAVIKDNRFEHNGNDGLDISSSTVSFENNSFLKHERCLEIGESSDVFWRENAYVDCATKFSVDGDSIIRVKEGNTL